MAAIDGSPWPRMNPIFGLFLTEIFLMAVD